MPLTDAAQAVQRSAFPDAYAKHEPIATQIVNLLTDGAARAVGGLAGARSARRSAQISASGWTVAGQGVRRLRLPHDATVPTTTASTSSPLARTTDPRRHRRSGDRRRAATPTARRRTAATTTARPTRRAAAGTSTSCTRGSVITRYCHMVRRPLVSVGQTVTAGQHDRPRRHERPLVRAAPALRGAPQRRPEQRRRGQSRCRSCASAAHRWVPPHRLGDVSQEPMPDPFAGQPDWAPRPPRTIVPVAASAAPDLRGRRLIVGCPGLGWRGDLRADDKVVQGSRTFVPAIPEQEWYRAEAEQIEVFAPLVPVERVWVETFGDARGHGRAPRRDLPAGLARRAGAADPGARRRRRRHHRPAGDRGGRRRPSGATCGPSPRCTRTPTATSACGSPPSSTGTGGRGAVRRPRRSRYPCTCCGSNSQLVPLRGADLPATLVHDGEAATAAPTTPR